MGLADLTKKLQQCPALALDSAPVIYFVEASPVYEKLVNEVFSLVDSGNIQAFTSLITLTEVLIYPLENNFNELANSYRNLLLHTRGIQSLEITAPIADKAGELRAKYSNKVLKTPDAIQIATALLAGCNAIITNDLGWKAVTEIEVIILEDYLDP
jgi:predicted nucleic acid-binding protein